MTKMKSKKMTKSTLAIIIMSIAMVAMLAFGGTYAYFTATTNGFDGEFKTATVMLTSSGSFSTTGTVVPNQKLTDGVAYKNKSDVAVHIFVTVKLDVDSQGAQLPTGKTVDDLVEITLAKTGETANFNQLVDGSSNAVAGVYYMTTTKGATNTTAGDDVNFATKVAIKNVVGESVEDAIGDWMGISFTLTIKAEAIQTIAEGGDPFATAYAAYQALTA